MKNKILIFLYLLFAFASCTAKKTQFSDTNQTIAVDEITFLVLKIHKDSIKNKITLITKTETNGKIKAPRQKPISQNYLTIEVFYDNSLYQTSYIPHPLYKTVEYTDEQNQLISKYVELIQDEFFIRVQTKPNHTKVRIYENVKDEPKKELLILSI